MESDRLNALVIGAGLGWREVIVIRAYTAYIRQIGTAFSQTYIATALNNNVTIVRLLVDLFETRFDPRFDQDREAEQDAIVREILGALDGDDGVGSLRQCGARRDS